MNSMNKIRPSPLQKTFLWGGAVVVLLVSIFALMQHTVKASPPPLLAQATLEAEALTSAQRYGLQGPPIAQKAVQMTLGEWYALTDSELGKDAVQIGLTPDVPVFVLAIRGSIEWRGPSGAAWWGGGPEHYDNITIVLNARTGDLMWVGAKRVGFSMPVPVPWIVERAGWAAVGYASDLVELLNKGHFLVGTRLKHRVVPSEAERRRERKAQTLPWACRSVGLPRGVRHKIQIARRVGCVNDNLLLQGSGGVPRIPADRCIRLDLGYEGIEQVYPTQPIEKAIRRQRNHTLTTLGKLYNQMLNRLRVPVEHIIGRLKQFNVLAFLYRGRWTDHEDTMTVIAGLINFVALGSLSWTDAT